MCQSQSQTLYRRSPRTRIIVAVNNMPAPFLALVPGLCTRPNSQQEKWGRPRLRSTGPTPHILECRGAAGISNDETSARQQHNETRGGHDLAASGSALAPDGAAVVIVLPGRALRASSSDRRHPAPATQPGFRVQGRSVVASCTVAFPAGSRRRQTERIFHQRVKVFDNLWRRSYFLIALFLDALR